MVAVPHTLKGKTILDAHQWVVSQIDGRNEYTLTGDMGQPATLSDLTTGKFTEVNIMPQGARSNPAPSYAFKPSHQPQKRIQQFSSRVLLPDGLSPSLIHALEAKHGSAYRFIASKMLAQRSRRGYLSPKGHRMLDSMVMADPISPVLSNPIGLRQTPSGLRMARIVGDRGRVMDDKIVEEVMNYLNEGDVPYDIGATADQFQSFRENVLQPYLISIESNMALIRYLNETLIPHIHRLIDNGDFTSSAFEAQGILKFTKAKAKAGAGKSELKKALAERYNTVVRRLATSPQDFYAGRNEALIANPLFMYPHARFMLLPPPLKLTGGTRAELFFYLTGEPPRYGATPDGEIFQDLPARIRNAAMREQGNEGAGELRLPLARINNQPSAFGTVMNADNVGRALRQGDIGSLITAASQAFHNTEALRRIIGLGAARPPGGLSSDEQTAIRELNAIANRIQMEGAIATLTPAMVQGQYNAENIGLAAAIELNIGGLRPRPVGWPEGMVMSMMRVLGENIEQIVNRGDGDFFVPQIEGMTHGRVRLVAPVNLDNQLQHLSPSVQQQVRNFYTTGITLDDLTRDNNNLANVERTYAAALALHFSVSGGGIGNALPNNTLPSNAGEQASRFTNFQNLAQDPSRRAAGDNHDMRLAKFTRAQSQRAPDATPGRISILNIMQDTITRFKESGGQPTPEHVTFTMQLLSYCLANMDAEVEIAPGIMDALAEAINLAQTAANESRIEEFTNFITQLDERREAVPDENVLQAMVFDRLLENMLTDIVEGRRGEGIRAAIAGGAFGDVNFDDEGNPILANPRPNPPIENLASIIGDKKDLDALRKARDGLRQRRKQSRLGRGNAEAFMPDEATIRALSQRLEGVFREALAATEAERTEAKRVMARNKLIEARLGNMAQIENRRNEMTAFQRIIRHINDVLTELINHEEEYVRGYMRVPDDPFMDLDNNISREQMMNHPLYNAQMLHGQHEMFMRHISNVENQVRSALRVVQGQIARMGAGLAGNEDQMEFGIRANENLLEYYAQAIEFCNGLQEAYGEVGGFLNRAIEDMRSDDPDNLSVNLYLALFDVADNFMIRSGVRAGLRMSAETVSSPVNPVRNEVVFNEITEKCFNIIADLFGAFPGNIPANPPNRILQLGTDYLMALVNANLGFGGDREAEMQRDEIIQQTVATNDRMERAMERQRQRFYLDEKRRERALAVEEQAEFLGGDRYVNRQFADLMGGVDARLASEESARREKASGEVMRSTTSMIDDLLSQSERDQAMSDAGRLMMFDQDAINDAVRKVGMMRFKEDLRRPGSALRESIAESQFDLRMAAAPRASLEMATGITPRDQEVMMAYSMNNAKLDTMALDKQISERMRDYAKSKNYHWTTVVNILEGAKKGRDTQAQIREVEKALKAAGPEFQIDTPENVYNDISTQIGLADQEMFDRTFMRNPPGVKWYA